MTDYKLRRTTAEQVQAIVKDVEEVDGESLDAGVSFLIDYYRLREGESDKLRSASREKEEYESLQDSVKSYVKGESRSVDKPTEGSE